VGRCDGDTFIVDKTRFTDDSGSNVDHAIGGVSLVLEAIVAFSFQHRPLGSRCCESWFQSIAESQCGTSSRSIPRSSGHTSETYQMVNKLEKVPSPKFSIRDFGYVSVLGSQTFKHLHFP
jgi:hypothetical protein